jgi:aspartate/methionine/tyrosine aminotransferase
MASQRASSVASFKVMDVLQRANELQAAGHNVLHCEVGQPATGAPATVSQAAVSALTEPQVMGYTDAFGLLALREKISKHYQKMYRLDAKDVPTSRIVVTTGSSGAFLLAFTACFDTGDYVAIASSGYPCYRNILSALGCNMASIPINDEFKLTATELRGEVSRRKEAGEVPVKGLILSSPGNPTGAMLTPDELKELCELCEAENIQFLSDEIYHGITYGTKEATALEYSSKAMIINSFSKYYSSEYSYGTVYLDGMVALRCLVLCIQNTNPDFFSGCSVWLEIGMDGASRTSSGCHQQFAAKYVYQCTYNLTNGRNEMLGRRYHCYSGNTCAKVSNESSNHSG